MSPQKINLLSLSSSSSLAITILPAAPFVWRRCIAVSSPVIVVVVVAAAAAAVVVVTAIAVTAAAVAVAVAALSIIFASSR